MAKIKTISKKNSTLGNQNLAYGNFIDPQKVIEQLDIESGMKIAEFGCGTGYFVFPVAQKVGSGGTVYALDVVKEKLEAVESRAKLDGFFNIITKRANLENENGSGLEKESIDWVVLVNMLFQNKAKEPILKEVMNVLKKTGKVLVIEWNEEVYPIGPEEKLRVSKKNLIQIAEMEELKTEKEIEVSDFHYGIIFVK